jgi:hypothetical protein
MNNTIKKEKGGGVFNSLKVAPRERSSMKGS